MALHVPRSVRVPRSLLALAAIGASPLLAFAQDVSPLAVPSDEAPGMDEQMTVLFDTRKDVWNTEVWNDETGKQLGVLHDLIEHADEHADPEALGTLFTPDFSTRHVVPAALSEVFDDGAIRVLRWDPAAAGEDEAYEGIDGAARMIADVRAAMGHHPHLKFKTVFVLPDEGGPEGFATQMLVNCSGELEHHTLQINSDWNVSWRLSDDGGLPRISGVRVDSYEKVVLQREGVLFEDCTASAMRDVPCYRRQVLPTLAAWTNRLTTLHGNTDFGHHGLAVGDVNGDGLEDLYACDTGGLPNRLYVQEPDGSVREVAREAGVDWLDYSAGALLVDMDGDGDDDLVVAARNGIVVAENDGKGHFTVRQDIKAVGDPVSVAAADYDEDGDLDLFVCNYRSTDVLALPSPVPLYDARNGGHNLLLRNDGGFEMTDVTRQVGLFDETRFSFAAAWEDYDDDGDLDLYVANDFGPNHLFRNDGGRFRDVARDAAVEDRATGMSVAWGDYDRDGHMDLYVGNMFSSAGHRIAYQRHFNDVSGDEATSVLQRFARGNTLFHNAGDGTFADVSLDTGTTMGRWAWASRFCDLNNDGWQDLVVANGFLTNGGSGDL